MGSQLSQSQQLRNTFPISQYKILSSDSSFPAFVFLQRLSDSALFLACSVDKGKQTYKKPLSKHIIKRIQKKQIGRKVYELYQWASANVQGLVEYISLIDKSRKISKSEFQAIVQGSIRGYDQLSKESFQIECLEISMKSLRIFNSVSLQLGQLNSKEIVSSVSTKIMPKNLCEKMTGIRNEKQPKWPHVGECIHRGGILTQKQLLGEYLLQLSNYATKADSKRKNESLVNLKNNFGIKMYNVVESLLSNSDWATVIQNLDRNYSSEMKNTDKQSSKQITNQCQLNDMKKNTIQTQKTIDTLQRNKSEKILFHCFKFQNNNQQKQTGKAKPLNIIHKNFFQTEQKNKIISNHQFKSLSPLKSQRYLSPPSIKIVRQIIPPKIMNENSPEIRKDAFQNEYRYQFDTMEPNKTNSILTIFPDVFTNQKQLRSRIYSARNIPTNQNAFIESQKKFNCYTGSPQTYKQKISPPKQKFDIQKRKGKKIQLKPSKQNQTLKPEIIQEYQFKIKPDVIESAKHQRKQQKHQNQNHNFISQEFGHLNFSLSNNQFGLSKIRPDSINKQQQGLSNYQGMNNLKKQQISPKGCIKTDNFKFLSPEKQNLISKQQSNKPFKPSSHPSYHNPYIKQIESQTVLVSPKKVLEKKLNEIINDEKNPKQSKYIGSVNIKGQKQGNGKLIFPSGGVYIGNFFKDFMHGEGKLFYPSGRIAYEGIFKYDKFHGKGKLYNQNPAYIQAFDFRNFNKIEVTQKEQPIHKEHFLINPIQGQKKISYWKFYEGQMSHDMKHGKGILTLENGQRYEGQFKDDLVNGQGMFYGQNGKISGRWQDNMLLEINR